MSKPLPKNSPPVLSLTGGIGSGKSVLARIFDVLRIPVYDADTAAKVILVQDSDVVKKVTALFGTEAYKDGKLERAYLASKVFGNDQLRLALNDIVHPAVAAHFHNWLLRQDAPYVLKEAAIAIETGSHKQADWTALVTAPEALRIARVVERNGITADEVKRRMATQWPDDRKAAFADFIITNDGTQAVLPQTLHIHHTLLAAAETRKANFEKK